MEDILQAYISTNISTAGTVLRMFMNAFTEETFKKSLITYLTAQ